MRYWYDELRKREKHPKTFSGPRISCRENMFKIPFKARDAFGRI